MPQLQISLADVAEVGSQMSAAEGAPPATVTVSPPAQDPVSVTVARTLAARAFSVTGYSSTANAIAQVRGQMVIDSANTYAQQEAANTATLGDGAPVPDGGSTNAPPVAIPPLPAANVPPPAIGAPPAGGEAIAELIHNGPGPSGLHDAAAQLRQHASALTLAGTQLHGNATTLAGAWNSKAGHEATSRIAELATWYDRHAQAATSTASAIDQQATNFARARHTIPEPKHFVDKRNRIRMAEAASAVPGNFHYASAVATLKAELAELNRRALQGYSTYSSGAADPGVVGEPLEAPPRPGGTTKMAGYSPAVPQSGPFDSDDWEEQDWGDMEPVGPQQIDPGGPSWDGIGAGRAPVGYSPAPENGPWGDGEWEIGDFGTPQPVYPDFGGGDAGGATGSGDGSGLAPVSYSPAVPQNGPWGLDDDEWELNEWGQPQPVWPTGGGGGGASGGNSGVGTAPV